MEMFMYVYIFSVCNIFVHLFDGVGLPSALRSIFMTIAM